MKRIKKTVQGGVVNLTGLKEDLLDREFENLQSFYGGRETWRSILRTDNGQRLGLWLMHGQLWNCPEL